MKHFRILFIVATCALCYWSSLAPATQMAFHLKEAVSYAISHSPTLNSASREVVVSGLEKKNAASKFLPSLDLTGTFGLEGNSPSSRSTPWTRGAFLGLTETLYDNGESLTRYKISGLKKQYAELSYQRSRDLLCKQVATEFLRYSLSKRLLETQEEQVKLVKKQYQLVSHHYHQGLKTRKDYLRFKTQVDRADIDLINAKKAAEDARGELKRLMGIPIDSSDTFEFLRDDERFDLNAIPTNEPNLKRHYEYQMASLQKDIHAKDTDLIKRKYWPELSLTSGISYQNSNYAGTASTPFTGNDQWAWNAMITLRYNFWDWGTRRRDSEIAEHRQMIQANDLDNKLLGLRSEVERLMIELQQLKSSVKLSQELLKLEQNNLGLLETEYQQGKVQYLDLMQGLKDLADAKIKYYSALYQLKQALFSYRYHEGTLYDSISKI